MMIGGFYSYTGACSRRSLAPFVSDDAARTERSVADDVPFVPRPLLKSKPSELSDTVTVLGLMDMDIS